jgi:hypothetical protein
MIGEVLCEVAEVAIGVSHDGRQDPKWNGKPGYTSEDDVFEGLRSHGRETNLLIAEHQDKRAMFPVLGRVGHRLEDGVERHVACCRLGDCTGLEK